MSGQSPDVTQTSTVTNLKKNMQKAISLDNLTRGARKDTSTSNLLDTLNSTKKPLA